MRERGEKKTDNGAEKDGQWSSQTWLALSASSLCHLLPTLFHLCLQLLLHYSIVAVIIALFPIFITTRVSSEGKKVTQTGLFPWWSWGGQSWDIRPAVDSKSEVSGLIMCVRHRYTVVTTSTLTCAGGDDSVFL